MENLRNNYNYRQRLEFQDTLNALRPYLLYLLKKKQNGLCALCNKKATKYDIDHKLYNPMETINELQLLCIPCHKSITDYRPMKARS